MRSLSVERVANNTNASFARFAPPPHARLRHRKPAFARAYGKVGELDALCVQIADNYHCVDVLAEPNNSAIF